MVRDHTKWWFLLKCDGFVSHVNVLDPLQDFDQVNIIIIKVEGYTSHATQSYDKQVAKSDNLETHYFIDVVPTYAKANIDQYMLA